MDELKRMERDRAHARARLAHRSERYKRFGDLMRRMERDGLTEGEWAEKYQMIRHIHARYRVEVHALIDAINLLNANIYGMTANEDDLYG